MFFCLYYSLKSVADNGRKLKIRRIYEMIPSNLENKKKRVIFQSIEDKNGKRFTDYQDEFEYLISAGIALSVQAVSTPAFPLLQLGLRGQEGLCPLQRPGGQERGQDHLSAGLLRRVLPKRRVSVFSFYIRLRYQMFG